MIAFADEDETPGERAMRELNRDPGMRLVNGLIGLAAVLNILSVLGAVMEQIELRNASTQLPDSSLKGDSVSPQSVLPARQR